MRVPFLLLVILGLALPAAAGDGVLEINHACATGDGCFPGDAPGYPVEIIEPGSYRLTGNLEIRDAATDGVLVKVDDVSLDLGGFEIRGVIQCTGSPLVCIGSGPGSGVNGVSQRGVRVSNGLVVGAGSFGVLLGTHALVDSVHVRSNGIDGVQVSARSLVRNCVAFRNGRFGFTAAIGVNMTGNAASENGSHGLRCNSGCSVTGNTSVQNGGDGINVSIGSLVRGNSAFQNGEDGIESSTGGAILDNNVSQNGDDTDPTTDDGIECSDGCSVRGNTVRDNRGYGLNLGNGSVYRENVVTQNDTGTVTGTGTNRGANYCSGPGTTSDFCP